MRKKIVALFILASLFLSGCNAYAPPPALPEDSIHNGNGAPSETPGTPDVPIPGEPEEPNEPEEPEEPDVPEEPAEPDPPPAAVSDVLVRSNTDSLTVRSGKGTSYAALGCLDENDMAGYIALSDGWYMITYKRRTAYVSAKYATTVSFVKGSEAVEEVINEGKQLLGIPYVFGAERYHWGNGVMNSAFDGKSFDCSSFTQFVYKLGANVNLATTSREQSLQGRAVSKANIRRGDLLFFTNASRYHYTGIDRIGHVALYLGDNYIMHTASDHAVIEPISAKRWSYYITARRFL